MLSNPRYESHLLDDNESGRNLSAQNLCNCSPVAVRQQQSRDDNLRRSWELNWWRKMVTLKGNQNVETAGVAPPHSHRSRGNSQVPLSLLHLETRQFPTLSVPTEFQRSDCSPPISLLLSCFTDVTPTSSIFLLSFSFSFNFPVNFALILADMIKDMM